MLKQCAQEYVTCYALATLPNCVRVAILNGYVMGAGVGLTWHSQIRIATENTMFAMPETGIGYFTDCGGAFFLPRIRDDPCLGLFIALTGFRVKGKDMIKYGLATHFVPQERLPALQDELKKITEDTDIEKIVSDHTESVTDDEIPNIDEIRQIF